VVASLSRFPCFAVFADTGEGAGPPPSEIDVVVADYASAVSLGDSRERAARGLARARILALTANDREVDIRRAIQAGIHGYVLVGGPLSELVEAVSAVADGVRYLCRAVAQRMADSLTHASLTLREVEVLELVVDGESNKAIARRLEIEVGTVKSHMSAIMAKLGATSRTQAASIAASRGLIEERFERAISALCRAPRRPPAVVVAALAGPRVPSRSDARQCARPRMRRSSAVCNDARRRPGVAQPKVNEYAAAPASRNSISKRRSAIGAGWRMS
jgi:two-component system NarL family response regulator